MKTNRNRTVSGRNVETSTRSVRLSASRSLRSGLLALVAMLTCATQASADTAVCTGPLTTVANHANGVNGLYVIVGGSNIIRVCSFTAAQFTVTPEDCKHMASLAALAFATSGWIALGSFFLFIVKPLA